MKDWLREKEKQQKDLFEQLLNLSIQTLKEFNIQENKKLSIRVIFSKDEWLDGYANIELLTKNSDNEYEVQSSYKHSIYNTNNDIYNNSILSKLMSKGLLTNTWFSVLDSSRTYDTTFVLNNEDYVLENDNCEYRENRNKQTHTGFNIISSQEKKKKMK